MDLILFTRKINRPRTEGRSAASVAAFLSPFEVGSDVGGSIRYPAHCCGVFGLRPTHGLVPFGDIGPTMQKKSFSNVAVAGPLARTIEDLKLVLAVLSGTTDSSTNAEKLKIAYTLEWSGISLDEKSNRMLKSFIESAKAMGHELAPINPPIDFDHCTEIWGTIIGYEYKQMIPAPFKYRPFIDIFNYFFNVRRFREGSFGVSFQKGLFANKSQYEEALKIAEALRANYAQIFKDFDIWLTPVSAGQAIKHQKTGTSQVLNSKQVPYSAYLGNFVGSTGLLHHPILVAPIESSDSELPIGIQFHGKAGEDWKLLSDCSKMNGLFLKPRPQD